MGQKEIIKAAFFTPTNKGWGLPLLLEGEPGTVKTAQIEMICDEYGLPCETLSPGERGEAAFGCTPMPVQVGENTYMDYPRPVWTMKFDEDSESDGRGVVFVDEITLAQGGAKAALLGLLLDKRIGGHYLGRGVRVIGAHNTADDSAGDDLTAAAANRVGHIKHVPPSVAEWNAWLSSEQSMMDHYEERVSAEKEEARVMALWGEHWNNVRGIVTAFMEFKNSAIHVKPGAEDPRLSKAWASRRSWYHYTLAKTSAKVHKLSAEDTSVFCQAFVGEEAAKAITSFEAALQLPNIADVLDGTTKFRHDPVRLDITRVVLNSCALTLATDCDRREKRAQHFWDMLLEIGEESGQKDLVLLAAQVLAKSQTPLKDGKRLTHFPTARKVMGSLKDQLKAAGINV